MQIYTESTDGTYIEVKESALVWHYSGADPDFGSWQVRCKSCELKVGGCQPSVRWCNVSVAVASSAEILAADR